MKGRRLLLAVLTAAVLADNPGRWLVHCHNLLHVGESAGSMTGLVFELVVE